MGHGFGVLGGRVCVLVGWRYFLGCWLYGSVVMFHVHNILRGMFTWYCTVVHLKIIERFDLSTV